MIFEVTTRENDGMAEAPARVVQCADLLDVLDDIEDELSDYGGASPEVGFTLTVRRTG